MFKKLVKIVDTIDYKLREYLDVYSNLVCISDRPKLVIFGFHNVTRLLLEVT